MGENYIMEGLYTKENLWAEFALQETKAKKVKWLKEIRELRQSNPAMFRGTNISVKQFDNLIVEWDSKEPFASMKADIKRREAAERDGDG